MKLCDITQFYSPVSGGVKRYVHEKIAYLQDATADEHILIIPGAKTECIRGNRSRIYHVRSPLVSRASRYRVLLNLRALDEILEEEQPDLIESADPYQVGWKAVAAGDSLRIPVVGFYHSHFPEAYLRGAANAFGGAGGRLMMNLAQAYVRKLYSRYQATLVPSERLADLLRHWGVMNVRNVHLGVNSDIFFPQPDDAVATRAELGVPQHQRLLLYVGRLAGEKNTQTLFRAFDLLRKTDPDGFCLLVIGDGPQRGELARLREQCAGVKWIPYCPDSATLARYYRAADLFVHPGIQETFGLVAVESQACGTPVLGIRGSNMMIRHRQDFWAEANTPSALAEAITASGQFDLPGLGAAAARAMRHEFSWPSVFEKLFSIYREVVSSYRSGS
ncbi:MAG: glycosyltransferase [Verrucomicrobiota bacterium]